jgi:hypothetical protein
MKIIGVMPSLSFVRHVIQNHVFQTGIMAYGRPEFYFVMSPAHYFVSIFETFTATVLIFVPGMLYAHGLQCSCFLIKI